MGVLRRLFGPSKAEIWRQLSEQIGGRYTESRFLKGDRVEAAHDEWTVTLDNFAVSTGKVTVVYTRMRAPYVNPAGFRFTVYRKGLFSGVGKLLGMQDIEIGDPQFDHDFIIKGTDESIVRQLFSSPKLRELITAQRDIQFSVKDDEGWFGPKFPEGVDELYFVAHGVIKDIDRLKQLYELFAETLDQLCRIDAAYEGSVDVRL
jgi:hypothetical protein